MQKVLHAILGAIIVVFVYLLQEAVSSRGQISDNEKANEIFSQYINDLKQKIDNSEAEKLVISAYKAKIESAIRIIDSAKFEIINFPENADSILIVTAINTRIKDFENARSILYPETASNRNVKIDNINSSLQENFYYIYDIAWDYKRGSRNINLETIQKILNDKVKFQRNKIDLISELKRYIADLTSYSAKLDADKMALSKDYENIVNAKKNVTENARDKLLITMVVPVFAVILSIIIFIPYLLRDKAEMFNKLLDDKILIQVFTIFILVISILLLGIGDKLSSETLGTLLGGISVYVLQRTLTDNR